jgi:peptidoglycan/xylan/chitin deacetylase (PgdA/CDA1 family)
MYNSIHFSVYFMLRKQGYLSCILCLALAFFLLSSSFVSFIILDKEREAFASFGVRNNMERHNTEVRQYYERQQEQFSDAEGDDQGVDMGQEPIDEGVPQQRSPSQPFITDTNEDTMNKKIVILTFDDGKKGQYINGKPILDKYGFKATFNPICGNVEEGIQSDRGTHMNWEEIISLHQAGHEIGSHTMNHEDLSKLSEQALEFEVGQSRQCLLDRGIDVTSFSYPFNGGDDNETVINTVAKYYERARTATGPLMHLNCNGAEVDCKYSIMGWSHDADRKDNFYDDSEMFARFIEVVNSQTKFKNNNDGKLGAIPVIVYHDIDDIKEDYTTSVDLFDAEMKYLYDNNFTVLTLADLGYDESTNYLKINDNKLVGN